MTIYVYVVYLIALRFEGYVCRGLLFPVSLKTHRHLLRPFTDMIYSKREEERAKAKAGKSQ